LPDTSHEAVPQRLRAGALWYDAEMQVQWLWDGSTNRYYDPELERYLQPNAPGGSYVFAKDAPIDDAHTGMGAFSALPTLGGVVATGGFGGFGASGSNFCDESASPDVIGCGGAGAGGDEGGSGGGEFERATNRTDISGISVEEQVDVDPSLTVGSGERWTGRGKAPQWGNPNSVKAYGHSITEHGPQIDSTRLADRAARTGNQQGQWFDHQDYVRAEQATPKHPGTYRINFHRDIGTVYLPDGSVAVNVTQAVVVRTREGLIRTSYPVTDGFVLSLNTGE